MQDNAENTLYEFKRFIGKPYSQVAADRELSRFPFAVVNQSGRPMFRIPLARNCFTRALGLYSLTGVALFAARDIAS
jgi:hypothetical protein